MYMCMHCVYMHLYSCMCACVCTFVCVCTCMHECAVCMHVYSCMCACTCACVYMYAHACLHVCLQCMCVHVCVHMCICGICTCICVVPVCRGQQRMSGDHVSSYFLGMDSLTEPGARLVTRRPQRSACLCPPAMLASQTGDYPDF